MNNGILSYDLVDPELEPVFAFPNLEEFKPETYTKEFRVSCLTYRKDLGDYEERFNGGLSKEILNLVHKTRKEIRNVRKEYEKEVKKLKFRNFINPFSKTKENNIERAVSIAYVGTPTIGIPASFIADSEIGLLVSIFIPIVAEASRRLGIYERKSKMKKINKKLRQPKIRIFSDMLERKNEINVDSIFVEPASRFMEKIKGKVGN